MTYSINGELVQLSENNGIMINSRQIHYGFSAEHTECEFICLLLSPELLQGNKWFYHHYVEYITDNFSCPYLFLSGQGWQADILKKTDLLYRSVANKNGSDSADNLPYFDIIEIFCSIMKILYEKQEHFTEHISLDDIAFAGACCKSHCAFLFKKYLRDTPVSYITKLRLRKSLVALLEPDSRITDIAYEYGFSGASYYCETFRKYYGTSPLKYRKRLRLPDSLPATGSSDDIFSERCGK